MESPHEEYMRVSKLYTAAKDRLGNDYGFVKVRPVEGNPENVCFWIHNTHIYLDRSEAITLITTLRNVFGVKIEEIM